MTTEIRVPILGESITEATIGKWFKQAGDRVTADEPLVELETDKVTVEVPAPASGILSEIAVKSGDTVAIGSLLGSIGAATGEQPVLRSPAASVAKTSALEREPSPRAEVSETDMPASPAARKHLAESGLSANDVHGSGRRGQVLKHDVVARAGGDPDNVASAAEALRLRERRPTPQPAPRSPISPQDEAREERVHMTRLRQTIARRLKEAQDTAAMLTTFNDVDMGTLMQVRRDYRDAFQKKHGIKLGMMGFFVKACVEALKELPAVNAEIDGTDIVYKNYYHIGVAVGTERGLVVPLLREADRLSLAEIESRIADFGARAREGKLGLEELQGGTFTISNGGTYGSLLSTPILNAPQSGILGMHRIEDRAVVRDGQIVARPMMYLALSYDHRLVDGKDAVTFLAKVKEAIEDPKRLVLNL
jgi:2-oxoglutarate dehydrogenase E2 component (dihydrolipoamide succinyltransferase)